MWIQIVIGKNANYFNYVTRLKLGKVERKVEVTKN